MSELINKLKKYRSTGEKYYPEDIIVIDDLWLLIDEIERLNNIINKAIKYIENHMQHNTGMNCADMTDLVDILKDSDEE